MNGRYEAEQEKKLSQVEKQKPLTAAEIALQKGAERREKIGKFFNSLKDRISSGVDKGATYALGAPEAVAHAGGKAWDTMTESTGRFFDKVDSAAVRLEDRVVKGLGTATNKVADLGKRAAAYGLNNFAAPVESRIRNIFTLPAVWKTWRADVAEQKGKEKEARINLETGNIAAEIDALNRRLQLLREKHAQSVARASEVRRAAQEKSGALNSAAEQLRGRMGGKNLARQLAEAMVIKN